MNIILSRRAVTFALSKAPATTISMIPRVVLCGPTGEFRQAAVLWRILEDLYRPLDQLEIDVSVRGDVFTNYDGKIVDRTLQLLLAS